MSTAQIRWPRGPCSFSFTSRVNIVLSTSSSTCKWLPCDWCDQCYVRQSLICHIDLFHPSIRRNVIWIIIEININPDDITNNNLILPIFCRALIYYRIIISLNWILISYYWIIIIYTRLISIRVVLFVIRVSSHRGSF